MEEEANEDTPIKKDTIDLIFFEYAPNDEDTWRWRRKNSSSRIHSQEATTIRKNNK